MSSVGGLKTGMSYYRGITTDSIAGAALRKAWDSAYPKGEKKVGIGRSVTIHQRSPGEHYAAILPNRVVHLLRAGHYAGEQMEVDGHTIFWAGDGWRSVFTEMEKNKEDYKDQTPVKITALVEFVDVISGGYLRSGVDFECVTEILFTGGIHDAHYTCSYFEISDSKEEALLKLVKLFKEQLSERFIKGWHWVLFHTFPVIQEFEDGTIAATFRAEVASVNTLDDSDWENAWEYLEHIEDHKNPDRDPPLQEDIPF